MELCHREVYQLLQGLWLAPDMTSSWCIDWLPAIGLGLGLGLEVHKTSKLGVAKGEAYGEA